MATTVPWVLSWWLVTNKSEQVGKFAREFQKTSTSALLTMPKVLTMCVKTNWKIFRDGNTRPPYMPPEKSVKVKKQQLELDMEQRTGSK